MWELKKSFAWPATWGRPPIHSASPSTPQKERIRLERGKHSPPVTRKLAPTHRNSKKDKKELSKDIDLSILSRVSRNVPEPQPTEIKATEEPDELRYGTAQLQVPKLEEYQNLPAAELPSLESFDSVSATLPLQMPTCQLRK